MREEYNEKYGLNGTNVNGFWRDATRCRTTNTGMNTYAQQGFRGKGKEEGIDAYCNRLVECIKNSYDEFTYDERIEYFETKNRIDKYHKEIVSDCIKDMNKEDIGSVFTRDQLLDVLRLQGFDNCAVNIKEYDTYEIKLL